MSRRPTIDAYVLNNNDDGNHDVFYTLAAALGQPPRFQAAVLPGPRQTIVLRGDVHREHGCASAVLVVNDVAGVDETCVLSALHARREGVENFILLIDERRGGRGDALERDARGLLERLDIAGDEVPAVRAPLTRCAGRTPPPMVEAMRRLLVVLDDLPFEPALAPAFAAPADLRREALVLDALRSLLAPATRIDGERASYQDTLTLCDGAGGSFEGGAVYVDRDEAWPVCPSCRQPMGGLLQIDARATHHPPPEHGVFVVFTCTGMCGTEEIRHHLAPSRARRRGGPPAVVTPITESPTILRPAERCWLLPDRELFHGEYSAVAARLSGDPEVLFDRVAAAMGVAPLQYPAHFGGYHGTEVGVPTPRCDVCAAPCVLVAQIDAGDDHRSLWACREHPSCASHRVHP